ncbi:MAG: M1 family metallopeptidase [Planctomycetota bacterium]
MRVTLPSPKLEGDIFMVRVEYDGYPQCEDHGCLFTHHNGEDLIYTLSEPWSSYKWWPVKANNLGKGKADLVDKATADLSFTVPATMEVASNGILQSTTLLPGDLKKFHWRTNYPTAPYLFCFAATNYIKLTDTYYFNGTPLDVEFYIYPEDEPHLHEWTDKLEYMFNVFNEKYGMYPYMDEKYGIAQVESPGGMEHQTMTFQKGVWGDTWHGYDRSEMVTAHELAHQWWGDVVTCMTWNEIWLNEGFASYSEAIWIENADDYLSGLNYGEEAFHEYMEHVRCDLSFNPPGVFPTLPGEMIYRSDISTHEDVFDFNMVYAKAAWVLHMLRHFVSDDKFFCFLKHYRDRFEFSSAETNDLMHTAEDIYGRTGPGYLEDLSWFFDEWIYRPGAPLYNCWWYYKNSNTIIVKISQRQRLSGHPLDTVFTMPIDIVYIKQNVEHKVVLFDEPDDVLCPINTYEITTNGLIGKLIFDPDNWILKRLSLFPPGQSQGSSSMPGSSVTGSTDASRAPLSNTVYVSNRYL